MCVDKFFMFKIPKNCHSTQGSDSTEKVSQQRNKI